VPPSFGEGELSPHLAHCGLDRGPSPCQVPSWSIQLFGHNTPTFLWPQYTNITDRQTDRQDKWSDSIGWTILQTVTQKSHLKINIHNDCVPTLGSSTAKKQNKTMIVPKGTRTFRAQDQMKATYGNPGTFVPPTFRSRELLFPGLFVPRKNHSQQRLFLKAFVLSVIFLSYCLCFQKKKLMTT